MKTMFLFFIVFVFVTTMVFGVLLWKQTYKIEKRALEAKRLKEEHIRKLELANVEKELQEEMQKMADQRQEMSNAPEYNSLSIEEVDLGEA